MTIRLFSGPLSMFGAKAQIAALEKGLEFELVMVAFDKDDAYQPKHPEVLRINAKAQVPVLIDGDLELFDSTQIFEYLEDRAPEPALWPAAVADRARARLLEHSSDEPRLLAWRERVGARPAVRAVVGPMMRFLALRGRPVPPYLQSHLVAA